MSVLKLSVDLLEDIYGITCVENQFIATLRFLSLPYQATYIYSFIDIKSTILDFYTKKIEYAYYDEIERLQDVSRKLKIASLTSCKTPYDMLIVKLGKQIAEGLPLLIKVNPLKLPRMGEILPWRNDHFILLFGMDEENFYALDDVPRREVGISGRTLAEAYDGLFLSVNQLDGINLTLYERAVKEQIQKLNKASDNLDDFNIEELLPTDVENLLFFRDALGIIRISRRRIKSWLEWLEEAFNNDYKSGTTRLLEPQIATLDRLYSVVEFGRIRRKINHELMANLQKEIMEQEATWLKSLIIK